MTDDIAIIDRPFVDTMFDLGDEIVFAGRGQLLFVDKRSGAQRIVELDGWPRSEGTVSPLAATCIAATSRYFYVADSSGGVQRVSRDVGSAATETLLEEDSTRRSCSQTAVLGSSAFLLLGNALWRFFDDGGFELVTGVLAIAGDAERLIEQHVDAIYVHTPDGERRQQSVQLDGVRLLGLGDDLYVTRGAEYEPTAVARIDLGYTDALVADVAELPPSGASRPDGVLAVRGDTVVFANFDGMLWGSVVEGDLPAPWVAYDQRGAFDDDDFEPGLLLDDDAIYWFAGPHGDEEFLHMYRTHCAP